MKKLFLRREHNDKTHGFKVTDDQGNFVTQGPLNGVEHDIWVMLNHPIIEVRLKSNGTIELTVGRIESRIVSS